jgi:hypothetical protein
VDAAAILDGVSRLPVPHALAVRRLAVALGALAASLGAHCGAAGDLAPTGMAPAVWIGFLSMVTLLGARRGWRPRGFAGSLALMLGAQAVLHAAMTAAPWAFGLAPHHAAGAALAPSVLAAHAGAAVVLAALIAWLEAGLGRAIAIVRRVRRWLAARPAARGGLRAPRPAPARTPRRCEQGRLACRGPPVLRPA